MSDVSVAVGKLGAWLQAVTKDPAATLAKITTTADDVLKALTGITTHAGSSGEYTATVTTNPTTLEVLVAIARNGQPALNIDLFPITLFGVGATTAQSVASLLAKLATDIPDALLIANVISRASGFLAIIEALAPLV
jgi:hypothetical protein